VTGDKATGDIVTGDIATRDIETRDKVTGYIVTAGDIGTDIVTAGDIGTALLMLLKRLPARCNLAPGVCVSTREGKVRVLDDLLDCNAPDLLLRQWLLALCADQVALIRTCLAAQVPVGTLINGTMAGNFEADDALDHLLQFGDVVLHVKVENYQLITTTDCECFQLSTFYLLVTTSSGQLHVLLIQFTSSGPRPTLI
jgi:hypothetical protein